MIPSRKIKIKIQQEILGSSLFATNFKGKLKVMSSSISQCQSLWSVFNGISSAHKSQWGKIQKALAEWIVVACPWLCYKWPGYASPWLWMSQEGSTQSFYSNYVYNIFVPFVPFYITSTKICYQTVFYNGFRGITLQVVNLIFIDASFYFNFLQV